MKRCAPVLVFVSVVTLLLFQASGQAQGVGPVVDMLGRPDAASAPPNVAMHVSVIDPDTGRFIEGLSDANFAVQVSGEDVQPAVSTATSGVAVVIVVDRGGISRSGDPRIGRAVDLMEALLNMLQIDGSAGADMVGLIGIRGRDEGGLTPVVPFTDFDPNAVRNEFNTLRTEPVNEVTPLYDGIDRAIEWFTENPDATLQDKLATRRPIIIVFSDGIDNRFSSEAHETIIIDKCLENDILLYAVRMEGGPTDADNLEALAAQTNGIYVSHTPGTDAAVLGLFEDVVTQRQSYRVTFPLLRRQGDYEVRVRVLGTALGDGSDSGTVSSRLQLTRLAVTSPAEGAAYTVPYSSTLGGYVPLQVPLQVALTAPDGIRRDPAEVVYFAGGVRVGSSTAAPTFDVAWEVSSVVTPTGEAVTRDVTLVAVAEDPYLGERIESEPLTIRVTWEAVERTLVDETEKWFLSYWWLLLILALFAIGFLFLLILLIKTRGELAKKVVTQTTGVFKGVTQRLSTVPSQAPGKLVVVHGANVGREFRLGAPVVKVGRDPQFCDFPLYDEYTSNPHFSVQLDQTNFYVTDEGSTNGTRINGMPIRPHQRVLLQPDAVIEAGQTRLQFKRLGGTTRQLGVPGAIQPAGGGGNVHPPTQPARPPDPPKG